MDLEFIATMRPMPPSTAKPSPYLHRIDSSRIYWNNGPLVAELERRLAMYFSSLPEGGVVSAASGTAAFIVAILTTAGAATAERGRFSIGEGGAIVAKDPYSLDCLQQTLIGCSGCVRSNPEDIAVTASAFSASLISHACVR